MRKQGYTDDQIAKMEPTGAQASRTSRVSLRDAAALVIVAMIAFVLIAFVAFAGHEWRPKFWLLMMPPPTKSGRLDLKAPLRDWETAGHLLSSRADCERIRQGAMDFTDNKLKRFYSEHFKKLSESQFAEATAAMSHAVCVSSDDPRLAK